MNSKVTSICYRCAKLKKKVGPLDHLLSKQIKDVRLHYFQKKLLKGKKGNAILFIAENLFLVWFYKSIKEYIKIFVGVTRFSEAYGKTKSPQTLAATLLAGMGLLIHRELNTVALTEIWML